MKTNSRSTLPSPSHPRPSSDSHPLLPPSPDAHRYGAERPGKRRRVFTFPLQRMLLAFLLALMLLALFVRP